MRRVAILSASVDGHRQAGCVAAGLAERHDVLVLRCEDEIWSLGATPLGCAPADSLAAAVCLLGTAEICFPVGGGSRLAAIDALIPLPSTGSRYAALHLAVDRWATRLLAQEAGVPVAAGICVGRSQARGLDYLGPVVIRPARRGQPAATTRVSAPTELRPAIERALTDAERVVIEEDHRGPVVTVAVLRRGSGQILIGPPVIAEHGLAMATAQVTGETPVRAGRARAGAGPAGARPAPGSSQAGTAALVLADLDEVTREQLDRHALTLVSTLGAWGALTVSFGLGPDGPVLDDVDLTPDLGPHAPLARIFATGGTAYPDLLDQLVASAR